MTGKQKEETEAKAETARTQREEEEAKAETAAANARLLAGSANKQKLADQRTDISSFEDVTRD